MPVTGFTRIFLLIAGLVAAVGIGSLFALTRSSFISSPAEIVVTTPTTALLTSTSEATIKVCEPDDQASSCLPGEPDPSQDLADPGNGAARPAVSDDAHSADQARYVNDGRGGARWVSKSADSWIKIDLGQIRTINMVTLENGDPASSPYDDFGQFVIAVALSDVYAAGDSSDDDREYTPIFRSEQADFSGTVSQTARINILFSPVKARFVKIMFEKEGTAIEEVGVFMVEPSRPVEQPTRTPPTIVPSVTLTPTSAPTGTWLATYTSTSKPTDSPADTPAATAAPSQTPTAIPASSDTPIVLPTDTQPPANTETPVLATPLPSVVPPTTIGLQQP